MIDYCLSCCSTVDLSPERMIERNLHYVCFKYMLDGVEYPDDMGITLSSEELFHRMSNGADTKTSQVSVEEYITHFESILKEDKDILHVTLSTGLTGTYNSACIAREELKEKYPNRKIYIVDSLGASSGYGLIMDTLADMRDAGKTIDELYNWVETMLNICPLLNMDNDGHLAPREKIRGKRRVIKRIVEQMATHAQQGLDYSGKCFICHSLCMEDAQAVSAMVKEQFPKLQGEVEIFPIGTTIGSHTGPGTMALFFWGDERIN